MHAIVLAGREGRDSGKGFKYTCLERGSCLSGKELVKFLNVMGMDLEKQIRTLMIPKNRAFIVFLRCWDIYISIFCAFYSVVRL